MSTPQRAPRLMLATLALAGITALSGCGLLVVGGTAATTASVATDRRTTGEQVEDQAIEMKVAAEMRKLFPGDNARVNVTSYGGIVLLTGDIPVGQDKERATAVAKQVEKVKNVVNELRAGEVTPISVRSNDTWLTSKVKATLINTKGVPTRTINVTTERGIVYLLGRVTAAEGQMAGTAASGVSGVNKVVKLFEIVPASSINEPIAAPAAPVQSGGSTSSPSQPAGAGSGAGGVETMPVQ
ncbi:phospholipid-binding protein [Pollutimonas nitritireducens]|uniref:Phospholipid-binding protein n=1 Tax=Pollutimonas nitritireducens TaxID=2045209 RepID=A0A2N4UBS4_9BURK|nr:BON domain-containing protein [Pollutimonas nitritireducens]PLC52452.1 phospholipid-binding protein [Pollutimonas nitritireducens]